MQKPMSALLLSLLAWIFTGLSPQAALAAPAARRLPQKLLLTVGVSHYQDARWKALQFADKDAQDVYTRLKDTYDALPPLTSDRYGAEGVTLSLVRQQLKLLEQQNTREDDVIIVYFSGHGSLARSMDRNDPMGLAQYFVTSDTDFSRVRETALPRAELIKWFNGLRSKRKALILELLAPFAPKARDRALLMSLLWSLLSGAIENQTAMAAMARTIAPMRRTLSM